MEEAPSQQIIEELVAIRDALEGMTALVDRIIAQLRAQELPQSGKGPRLVGIPGGRLSVG